MVDIDFDINEEWLDQKFEAWSYEHSHERYQFTGQGGAPPIFHQFELGITTKNQTRLMVGFGIVAKENSHKFQEDLFPLANSSLYYALGRNVTVNPATFQFQGQILYPHAHPGFSSIGANCPVIDTPIQLQRSGTYAIDAAGNVYMHDSFQKHRVMNWINTNMPVFIGFTDQNIQNNESWSIETFCVWIVGVLKTGVQVPFV